LTVSMHLKGHYEQESVNEIKYRLSTIVSLSTIEFDMIKNSGMHTLNKLVNDCSCI